MACGAAPAKGSPYLLAGRAQGESAMELKDGFKLAFSLSIMETALPRKCMITSATVARWENLLVVVSDYLLKKDCHLKKQVLFICTQYKTAASSTSRSRFIMHPT